MNTSNSNPEWSKSSKYHLNPIKPYTFLKMEGEDEILEWSPKHRFARVISN